MTEHYNRPDQKANRRALRNHLSKSEAILWSRLSRRQIAGCKFRRQYGVDRYKIDFYCPEVKLAIEVDGDQHSEPDAKVYDRNRQAYIERYGIEFIRISSWEVCDNLDGVAEMIYEKDEEKLRGRKDVDTSPAPIRKQDGGYPSF